VVPQLPRSGTRARLGEALIPAWAGASLVVVPFGKVPYMSLLVPCSYCGARDRGKNAWLVWAWNRADGERVAWRQKLCVTCVATNLSPLLINAQESPLSCPACHAGTESDMDPIFVTYIIPGWDKQQGEFATCGPCAVEIRNRAQTGADRMEDRLVGVGAAAPTQTSVSAWDQLGLRPLR